MCYTHMRAKSLGAAARVLVNRAQQVLYVCTFCAEAFDDYDACKEHTINVHNGYWPEPYTGPP
ncbi:hypothetical protein BX070DRAFT_223946 [Coemansia spiralis]|nr:hypothetical protein BX070DRAFT_223946 [Coemansia spiralis]